MKRPFFIPPWLDGGGTGRFARPFSGRTRRAAPLRHEELESRVMFNVHPAGSVPKHIHTHLAIFVDGENFTIPASVGHTFPGPQIGTFNEDAHTHTDDGILHYNEGTTTDFKSLKDFFDTWGAIFTNTRIRLPVTGQAGQFVDRSVDATHTIRFQVNGAASSDFELYEPEDGDQMVISYEALPAANAPRLNPINNVTMLSNPGANALARTIQIPLDGSNPGGSPLEYEVSSSDSNVVARLAPSTNRSLRLNVSGRDIEGFNFTGDITLQLFEDLAPSTTARIMTLVNQGFYSNLKFHRVINDFVAQGGDPSGDGSGGSGVKFSDEYNFGLSFTGMGQLAMANSGDDTNDSQFFITDSNLGYAFRGGSDNELPPQHLNFQHTIFGQLTSGFDIFNKIMLTPVTASRPQTDVRINSATIFSDTQHAVLRLSASANFEGDASITVTARNQGGLSSQRVFQAAVLSDTNNDRAYLGAVPVSVTTAINTPVTIDLSAVDLENDPLTFVIRNSNNFANQPPNFSISINQLTRKATLTPVNDFLGVVNMIVGVRDATPRTDTNGDRQIDGNDLLDVQPNFDTQRISVTVSQANFSWTNAANAKDVDHSGVVAPLDALVIINELSFREVSNPTTGQLPALTSQPEFFYDVNGDGFAGPLDALLVINDLPSSSASSSSASSAEAVFGVAIPSELSTSLVDEVGARQFGSRAGGGRSVLTWWEAVDRIWST